MTKLLPAPSSPTRKLPKSVHAELVPVTRTLLFEEADNLPIYPLLLRTVPPSLMTRLLPAPSWPTLSSLFDQTEPLPVTTALLFEEADNLPMPP